MHTHTHIHAYIHTHIHAWCYRYGTDASLYIEQAQYFPVYSPELMAMRAYVLDYFTELAEDGVPKPHAQVCMLRHT